MLGGNEIRTSVARWLGRKKIERLLAQSLLGGKRRGSESLVEFLLTDTLAEHVPGCNMAFRKSCLEEIGGFDPIFHAAGDDVDICWRIQ